MIGGFIITGSEPKTIVLRALGPSLRSFGVPDVLSDPVLNLYNSSRTLIATNDNWQSDPHSADIQKNGFAPANLLESATLQTLPPGSYTVIVRGNGPSPGTGLVELYDLSPKSNSKLANIEHPRLGWHGGQCANWWVHRWRRGERDGDCARAWSIASVLWGEPSAKRSGTDNLRFQRIVYCEQQ